MASFRVLCFDKNGGFKVVEKRRDDVKIVETFESQVSDPLLSVYIDESNVAKMLTCTPEGAATLSLLDTNRGSVVPSLRATVNTSKFHHSQSLCVFAGKGKENIGSFSEYVKLMDLETNTQLWQAARSYNRNLNPYTCITLLGAQDRPTIIAGAGKKRILVYDTSDSKSRLPKISYDFENDDNDTYRSTPIGALLVNPLNENSLFVGTGEGDLYTVDFRRNKDIVASFQGNRGSVKSIAVHPKIPIVASCGLERFLRVWDVHSQNLLCEVDLGQHSYHVAFDPSFVDAQKTQSGKKRKRTSKPDEEDENGDKDVDMESQSQSKTEKSESKKRESKSASKEKGKGKAKKEAKKEPTNDELRAQAENIVREVDLSTKAPFSHILRLLGSHFGLDLMHRKVEVKAIITDVRESMFNTDGEKSAKAKTSKVATGEKSVKKTQSGKKRKRTSKPDEEDEICNKDVDMESQSQSSEEDAVEKQEKDESKEKTTTSKNLSKVNSGTGGGKKSTSAKRHTPYKSTKGPAKPEKKTVIQSKRSAATSASSSKTKGPSSKKQKAEEETRKEKPIPPKEKSESKKRESKSASKEKGKGKAKKEAPGKE